MSAPGSHIAGKLVKKALTLKHHRYQSGPWAVITIGHNLGGTYERIWAEMKLLHYSTVMLEWQYTPSTNLVELTGAYPGRGSTSDQTGVNSALRALGIQKYYSRAGVKHHGPSEVTINHPGHNPPTLAQAVTLLRKVGISLTKRGGEYRVAFRGPGNEHTAYYTNDVTDAMQTGLHMAQHPGKSGPFGRNPPGVEGIIPGDAEKLFYRRHGRYPGPYQHTFKGAAIIAMKNGDVVLRSTRGKKLWGRYS